MDDDPSVRRLLTRKLERVCSKIDHAGSAEEALERLRERAPDLVLLDVHMPGRPGHDVLDEIRSQIGTRLLPVVMISGAATREERLRAIRAGVTDIFTKPFDGEELVARVRSLLELKTFTDTLEEAHRVIVALARTVDARDPYTAGHSERVSLYSGFLAERAGMSKAEMVILRKGCLLHDLGKIAIRDHVLLKAGKLTSEEYAEIKQHPAIGHALLAPLKTLAHVLPVVHSHHERLDGSGYPQGLMAEAIPLMVRIASIADVYDALTSARPYRAAYGSEEAVEILRSEARKGWCDTALVEDFADVITAIPRGCLTPASVG